MNSKGFITAFPWLNDKIIVATSVHKKLSLWTCDKDKVPT